MIDVRIQSSDFDPGTQLERLEALHPAAVASFTALVAAAPGEGDEVMVDHYAAMAKDELARIAQEAAERWPLVAIILIHRHGRLTAGDRLAFAAAAAPERSAASEACHFLATQLTARAPFWKRPLPAEAQAKEPAARG